MKSNAKKALTTFLAISILSTSPLVFAKATNYERIDNILGIQWGDTAIELKQKFSSKLLVPTQIDYLHYENERGPLDTWFELSYVINELHINNIPFKTYIITSKGKTIRLYLYKSNSNNDEYQSMVNLFEKRYGYPKFQNTENNSTLLNVKKYKQRIGSKTEHQLQSHYPHMKTIKH
ncbi:MAG: hypothetical protein KKE73_15605 [Proteobacteria bacterium]|nr:hypothetical protein [Pseudomonadota bacterium]